MVRERSGRARERRRRVRDEGGGARERRVRDR